MAIPIPTELPHDEAEALLPWYATGQLEPPERAIVENHLQSCTDCQQQLFVERRMIDEFRGLTPDVDHAWARLRAQIEAPAPAPAGPGILQALEEIWRALTRPAVAGFVAAQAVFLLLGASLVLSMTKPDYRALGASTAPAAANAIVMFQPTASEQQVRSALRSAHATLVGGPTSSDAYLLHIEAADRAAAIGKLQSDRNVALAQPIDGSSSE
jgi:anti-sigma factor RsiW